jgi:hypothetical protein
MVNTQSIVDVLHRRAADEFAEHRRRQKLDEYVARLAADRALRLAWVSAVEDVEHELAACIRVPSRLRPLKRRCERKFAARIDKARAAVWGLPAPTTNPKWEEPTDDVSQEQDQGQGQERREGDDDGGDRDE